MAKHWRTSPPKLLLSRIGIVLVVVPILALTLYGQAFYGSVVGTVTDQSGGALSGAAVTLTNVANGERRQTKSGAGGDYQFLNLVPGTYRVEVEQTGFKKATREECPSDCLRHGPRGHFHGNWRDDPDR